MDKNAPLFDTTLTPYERAAWIVSQLTIDEKLLCLGRSFPEYPRLGLPAHRFGGEAAHGLQARADQHETHAPIASTSLVQPIGMVSSWDKELIFKAGDVTGKECRAFYNIMGKAAGASRFAPTVDLCRDPRWGRNEEGYGEDPYLTGKMAGSYIKGMQQEHNYDGSPLAPGERGDRIRVGANLKHFYANNVEWRRCYDNFDITDKMKYDYQLEPYRYCIQEAHAEGLMTCYNEINHVPGMLNHEVQDILKDKWGLHFAETDGGDFLQTVNFHHYYETHAETLAEAIKAGVDVMLDSPTDVYEAVKEAWAKGLMTEADIDKSLTCIFETRVRIGSFDPEDPYDALGMDDIGTADAAAISLKIMEEANVLLKNEEHFLPLDPADDIVLIGPSADAWYPDWYGGLPMYRETLKQGIEKLTGKSVRCVSGKNKIVLKTGDRYVGVEAGDKLRLVTVDDRSRAEVFEHTSWGSGCNFLYSTTYGKYVSFTMDGELLLEHEVPFTWFIMENLTIIPAEGATRLPDPHNANNIEFDRYWDDKAGDVRIYGFGARPLSVRDGVLQGNDLEAMKKLTGSLEGKNVAANLENSMPEPVTFTVEIVEDGIAQATALAKSADKVIVALGCNPVINAKEEIDRKSLAMIPAQEELLEAVRSVNPKVCVVLIANYPYTINRMQEEIPAILLNATGSQDLGSGIAAALFGTAAPAGRVPMTWYLSDDDLPDMTDYDMIKNPRTYRYFEKPVLYPFGYGLTYTEFTYTALKADKAEEGKVMLTVSVKNTGDVPSDEVVQLYMKRVSPSETVHPVRRLVSFERLHDVQPGEERTVTLTVNPCDMAIYMENLGERVVEAGTYEFYAGKNALDEALRVTLEI